MKQIKLNCYLLIVLIGLLWSAPGVQAQGGGCPVQSTPEIAVQYQVIDSIALAPAIPETTSARTPDPFYEDSLKLVYQPGRHVILASTPDGNGALCSDDLVKIQVSTGLVFEHDFRSADRTMIVPLEPLDVTGLFRGQASTRFKSA